MSEREVNVFFYGSYMNRAVLAETELSPSRWEVASLPGFTLRVAPRADLVRDDSGLAYGVLSRATHAQLRRLYAHSEHVLGQVYLPEAVLVHSARGSWEPALCYLAQDMVPQTAERAYVERILSPARELGFPAWYQQHIASFADR